MARTSWVWTPWQASGRNLEAGAMDEISQDPKIDFHVPRGRWLDAAVAVAVIVATASAVLTGRGSRPAASQAGRPGVATASALLPSIVRARIPLPVGDPGGMTILGSMAWISDWPASEIVGVDLAARRVTRTLHVGDQPDQPVSLTAGAAAPHRPAHRHRHQALPGPRAGRRCRLRERLHLDDRRRARR